MQQVGSGRHTPEFLSTHPSHETRIRDLTELIPQAIPLYESSEKQIKSRRLPLPGN
jgi:predicted Zn-dependent protease